jgi:hypothetical protein
VVQRGEWEDLKQRLERLPAGHPSSLDDEDPADEGWAEGDRADEDRADSAVGQSARHEAGRRPGPDRREPYRPWFASGDSADPWFSADPDARPQA